MKKPSIILSILILVGFFIFALRLISQDNICTWVRTFLCQKDTQKQVTLQNELSQSEIDAQKAEAEKKQQEYNQSLMDPSSTQYADLRKIGDSFVHLCDPTIIESTGAYLVDYSACALSLDIGKDMKSVEKVSINNMLLSQDQIDENLAKLWFSF